MKVTSYTFNLENKIDKSILFIELKEEISKSDKWQNKKQMILFLLSTLRAMFIF